MMGHWLTEFIRAFTDILLEMSPYLLLGFFFAGLLHIFFPRKLITRYAGNNNLVSVINASLLGVPLPLCSCGVIPTGVALYRHGASRPATISFITSTPQTGVDSILVTYSLMGLPFALLRPVAGFLSGIFGGSLDLRNGKKKKMDPGNSGEIPSLPTGFMPRLGEMLRYAFVRFIQDIGSWLVIGLVLAGVITVVIPDNFFTNTFGNDFLEMGLILVASIPVYICATGSVPIAAALMLKGLSPGAALVFLMAGPATNAATIAMIGKVLGRKSLFSYLAGLIISSLAFGLLINSFFPANWFLLPQSGHAHHHEILPYWLKLVSAILLGGLIINALLKKHLPRFNNRGREKHQSINTPVMNRKTIQVKGMTCNHCSENVRNSIQNLEGIEKVQVDLGSGEVCIEGDSIRMDRIRDAVKSVGYSVDS